MNDLNEDNLRAFLLGRLDAAETERLDELSIADDDFAAGLTAAENDLVDAYAAGALDAADRAAFESFYLTTQRRRSKLEFAQALRDVAVTRASPAAVAAAPSFFERLRLAWAVPAFAALLVAAVGIYWLAIGGRNRDEARVTPTPAVSPTPIPAVVAASPTAESLPTASPSPSQSPASGRQNVNVNRAAAPVPTPSETPASPVRPTIATIVLLPALRGGGTLPELRVTRETGFVDATLRLEESGFASCRVVLLDESGNEVWRSGAVRPRGASIAVRVPAGKLRREVYTFIATGAKDGAIPEEIGSYSFRVVLP